MNKQLNDFFTDEQLKIIKAAKGLTTIANQADKNDIVFYRISNVLGVNAFHERAKSSPALFYIVESHVEFKSPLPHIVVDNENFECLQKLLADQVYPMKEMVKTVGVTGTNGKTSVVNYCAKLLSIVGKKALAIGTIGISDGTKILFKNPVNTTPSFVDLRAVIFRYQDEYEYFIFEFSSHALHQRRLLDIKLDIAAWTSFSQDHLDYHKTMESYFNAKMIIFSHLKSQSSKVIVPYQEDFSYKILNNGEFKEQLHFTKSIDIEHLKLHYVYKQGFNLENIEIALMVVSLLGHPEIFESDLSEVRPPAGRFEIIEKNKKCVIVDYAHTPDALEKLLQSARQVFPNKKLHIIFGCGGDRDAKKRPVMGRIASQWSDKITVTSDNPRSEDPKLIIKDIVAGITDSKYLIEEDRKLAIVNAVGSQSEDEVVIVAGKGHESTQEIKGVKYPFDDKELVMKSLI